MLKRPRGGYRRAVARAAAVVGVALMLAVPVAAPALAQSSPSIPLTPTAQASGAAITYEHGIEFVALVRVKEWVKE